MFTTTFVQIMMSGCTYVDYYSVLGLVQRDGTHSHNNIPRAPWSVNTSLALLLCVLIQRKDGK